MPFAAYRGMATVIVAVRHIFLVYGVTILSSVAWHAVFRAPVEPLEASQGSGVGRLTAAWAILAGFLPVTPRASRWP